MLSKLFLNTKHYTFNSWSKLRKATLFAGVAVILLVFITTVWRWQIVSSEMYNNIAKLTLEDKKLLLEKGFTPNILANFWNVTLTFTWLSNLFVGMALILFAIYPKNWIAQRALFLANVYITITFIVFWALIFPFEVTGDIQRFITSSLVHFVNPVICFVFVILNRKNISVTKLTIWLSTIVMITYWAFALVTFLSGNKNVEAFKVGLDGSIIRDTKTVELAKINLYKEMNLTIYSFLNFKHPLFYKGDNLGLVIGLNIALFIGGFLLTPGLGFAWKYGLKVKYDTATKPWEIQ
ncbi:MAGa3780 family membrane protein [Mycoplasma nasistruthionis]|uniref:Uncharacterized protein n=1 Tax=Mycoplasma nasistruthionis TaxID=353852 RepID=A0A5B7XVU3_9MOLU|nr:hypothetical protein [Mycoplasma nasistruthionis]QCZ36899.1 hypothetical protein FG904_02695 [Mycoplasma nasistruthionis]